MDARARGILETIYTRERYGYVRERRRIEHDTTGIAAADLAYLAKVELPPNDYVELSHDDTVRRMRRAASRLEASDVAAGFVAGMASWPRGRQLLLSYCYARHLPKLPHDPGENGSGGGACGMCEISPRESIDRTGELLGWEQGGADGESAARFVHDLEDRARHGVQEPTADDRKRFAALLALVGRQPAGTTPGGLEKTIAKAKLIGPLADKYAIRGVLHGLAFAGVLPSGRPSYFDAFTSFDDRCELTPGGRSDLVWPLAAWRGGPRTALDRARAAELFAVAKR